MIFKAEPNLYVKLNNKIVQRVTGLKGFYFDSDGQYKTENQMMINVLKQNFKTVEENKETIEEIKEELLEYENKQVETVSFKCKKCDFETNNKGELLAHYKKDHPKEG